MVESPASGVSLKDLSPTEFSRVSALLDESIEMAPGDRDAWLTALERSEPKTAAILRALSASQDESRAQRFLEKRDLVARHVASMVDADPGLIGKQFGPYRVLALLGHGGMGSVWLAERVDGLFTRRVALKLVHPALKGRIMSERFAREREILASLNHPNIARLLDAGFAEDGQTYLALDYVAGTPLTTYCDERRLSVRERLQLFRQVLSAVQYAHAHLVIHRDLKPANILATEEGQVQLLDFGIAKLLSEGEAKETELTQLGGRAMTPDYAAPEQIAGAPITTAADVYALGVMLYELLTGERPYKLKRDSRGALEEAILEADPVAPSRTALQQAAAARSTTAKKLSSTLRGDLDTIAIKALKKSPNERYATANAFGEDIERFLRGDVVLAQPDSVTYRALKFARRHRVGIAAAGVLMLTLAGGLAATSYEAKVASVQRDAALQAQLRSLTQTAAGRLKDDDTPGALGIILEVLPHRGEKRQYTPEALSVFQEARAADAELIAITGHTDRLRSAAFSPDGKHIVTASFDKTARIWDAATGRQTLLLNGHSDRVGFAAFSPDGRRVVTASYDKTARIWDAATGREIVLLTGHTELVAWAAFSPDARRVVTASYDKTARIWDAGTGREIVLLSGHTDRVISALFSPDGQHIVTASADKTARIWDATTGREIMPLRGHTQLVASAAFSPDARRIVTASFDRTARIWDVSTGRELKLLSGHTDRVISAAFSGDGQRIVTASLDKTARIWDAATGRQIRLLTGHTELVFSALFSPDGRRVVTASLDRTARLWDAATGRQLMLLKAQEAPVEYASFSPDGRRIVTASNDKTARIWDAATGQQLIVLRGHADVVERAVFSADGRRIVTASDDKTVRIWDASTGRELMLLSGHTDQVPCAAFSPDGRRVVTASNDRTARIWDAATGQQLMVLMHEDLVESAEFSPDGQRVVTASDDKTARIWDARAPALEAQIGWAEAAQFDPLPGTARFQLGLPAPADVRQWPADKSNCDESAAAPYDPDRHASGIMLEQIVTDIAVAACADENSRSDAEVRSKYQQGRAFMANGNFHEARRDFEAAVAHGYRTARVDLGMLLSQPSAGMLDLPKAISLYEHGVSRSGGNAEYLLAPDNARAWSWYQRAAGAGEPNALARFADRDDAAAFSEVDAAKKNSLWLESFKYYASASERARIEDWPAEAWRNWRYRRASLAHLLARSGMMREVADAFDDVRKQYAPQPTQWQRLTAFVRMDY